MELIRAHNISVLRNSNVESRQLLTPANSASKRVSVTRVTMLRGAINPRHAHQGSEQVWICLSGAATLLLGAGKSDMLLAGDVVRFLENDIHGLENSGSQPVEYIAVTSPPMDFRSSYAQDWTLAIDKSRQ